jgi:hypothetical protein
MNPVTRKPDRIDSPLYIVTAIVNPCRYRSRWALYHDFARHVASIGARLITVEVAYGRRGFAVTDGGPGQVQLRTRHELWHKENALNLGFSRLPSDWKYAAWVDADVTFLRPDIVEATVHALQHYDIVQMWSRGLDLAPSGHAFAQYQSFADSYLRLRRMPDVANGSDGSSGKGGYWHSGYAWAIRREAFDTIGGLLDFAPLGAADYFMAWSLLGKLSAHLIAQLHDRRRAERGYTPGYIEALSAWESKAASLRKNIGCVSGTLAHHWHGKKRQRGYNERENILIDNRFDPGRDLRRDWQGLWQLHDDGSERSVRLRDQIRAYFQARDEDSTEYDGKEL